MRSTWQAQAPLYLAGAAAATTVVSIAYSEILLGAAFLALLLFARDQWRWPPVIWPLALWMGWTLVSLVASGHAREGLPQIRKFYVYLMLIVVYSALRTLKEASYVILGWAAGATLSSLRGFEQFVHKYLTTPPQLFYSSYAGARITGFADHWMILSALLMMVLMFIGAKLFFSQERRWSGLLAAAGVIVGAALILAFTKSMWVGAAAGAIWLLWSKNKWLAVPLPVMAGVVLVLNPYHVLDRDREHRAALREVGWEMIKAHPLVGVGPEEVGPQFMDYLPADIPRPIPKEWYYQHLHNIYFHFAAERGLPALAALLWFFGQALFDFSRMLWRLPPDSETRWILHGAIAVIIAILVSGWGEVNIGHSQVLEMFLAVIACGYIAMDFSYSTSEKMRR